MIELEEALGLLVNSVKTDQKTEKLDILSAFGRICAQDITAAAPVPHFPKSGMDGYALRSQDTKGASKENPACFQVVGEICAGDYLPLEAKPFTAVRVMTGGVVPNGYDCVIRQEDTDCGQSPAEAAPSSLLAANPSGGQKPQDAVRAYVEMKPWQNYCRVGEDIDAGRHLISKGTHLKSGHIGILASLGIKEILVRQAPKVGIISTGNELVPLGQPIGKVGVYPSSAYTIAARLKAKGIEVPFMDICADDSKEFSDMLEKRIHQADIIITTGALSVGKKDFLPEALDKMGAEKIFRKVNMRPGTPVTASKYKEKMILSMSGYPFAAMVNFQLFFWPVLAGLVGDASLSWERTKAVVAGGNAKLSQKRRFLQAFTDESGVHIYDRDQRSSVLSEIIHSNCMIDQKQGTAISPGDTVDIIYWSED